MPRRPVPCRICGEPCEVGGRSLAQPAHQGCRRSEHPPEMCEGCGKPCPYKRNWRDRDKPWMCLDCRRARPGYKGKWRPAIPFEVRCEVCGLVVQTKHPHQKTCLDEACRKTLKRRRKSGRSERYRKRRLLASQRSYRIWVLDCDECGRAFVTRYSKSMTCSDECKRKRQSRLVSAAIVRRYREDPEFRDRMNSRAQNRRAKRLGVGSITSPASLLAYLMERDKARCQIPDCQHTTRRIQAKRGPWRPSVDHVVPLSRGGKHELANLQLAHYRCNLAKHNSGGGEQLLLVG
jgi:5-methylcytosine-specific restriction endonuclease McrA